nr:hypothetical protein [Nocardioides ungokensis]
MLVRAMGLTCDAVTSMRVVTADRRVRTVTADEDGDLFWALRGGGGGHLGVVTSFTMKTSTAPTVSTVFLQWPLSPRTDVVPVWQRGRRTPTPGCGRRSRRSAGSGTPPGRCWSWRPPGSARPRPSTVGCGGCWTTWSRRGCGCRTCGATARRCWRTPAAWTSRRRSAPPARVAR